LGRLPSLWAADMVAAMMRMILSTLVALCCALPEWAGDVTVFAASSLKGAMDEVAAAWSEETGGTMRVSYAGSSALARQIEAGAPADLFLSANPGWVDYLDDAGLVQSRNDLLTNALVLVAPVGGAEGGMARLEGEGRVAMALVEAVPAGIYGKAALTHLGVWEAVAPRVVQADNVRAALALVARGEVALGIVYATDALAEPAVEVVEAFPAESQPPILYPAAALTEAGAPVLEFLESAAAREIFTRRGFGVVD